MDGWMLSDPVLVIILSPDTGLRPVIFPIDYRYESGFRWELVRRHPTRVFGIRIRSPDVGGTSSVFEMYFLHCECNDEGKVHTDAMRCDMVFLCFPPPPCLLIAPCHQ